MLNKILCVEVFNQSQIHEYSIVRNMVRISYIFNPYFVEELEKNNFILFDLS